MTLCFKARHPRVTRVTSRVTLVLCEGESREGALITRAILE